MKPLVGLRVICIDELGPLAAKTYPGPCWLFDISVLNSGSNLITGDLQGSPLFFHTHCAPRINTPEPTKMPQPVHTLEPHDSQPPSGQTASVTTLSITSQGESGAHHWHYMYNGLNRVIYACSDWIGSCPAGIEFYE